MKPPKVVFVCQECGAQAPKWMGRCAECGAWNSLVEEREAPAMAGALCAVRWRVYQLFRRMTYRQRCLPNACCRPM